MRFKKSDDDKKPIKVFYQNICIGEVKNIQYEEIEPIKLESIVNHQCYFKNIDDEV